MVMYYCVWTPQGVADEGDFDCLMLALKALSEVLSAMGEYWSEATRSYNILDRVSTATIRRFTEKLNETRSTITPLGSQATTDFSSNFSSEKTADWIDVDLTSNILPSLQFENGDASNALITPSCGTRDESFTSADLLSYFLVSGADMLLDGFGITGEYFPGSDEIG
jgi:hypothetical protein